MPDEPQQQGADRPAKPPVREHQEPQKQTQGSPGMAPEPQRAKAGDTLPDTAQNGCLIANVLGFLAERHSVAPATSPSVPSMAVPPPKMPAFVKKLIEPERIVLKGLSIKDPT